MAPTDKGASPDSPAGFSGSARNLIQIGDPRLKAKNEEIKDFGDPQLQILVDDLIATMRSTGLVGIAAPQIGENYQVFVTEPRKTHDRKVEDITDEVRVYCNPKIVDLSEERVLIWEGCGSVLTGQLFGPMIRPKTVTIDAQDTTGRRFRLKADGLLGRVILHEYDHVLGIEFLEKVSDYRQMMNREHYYETTRNSALQIANSKINVNEFWYVEDSEQPR